MTALLFHGPTAIDAMLEEPKLRGWHLPRAAYGLDGKGLKVDEARDLVSSVSTPPPTDRLCAYMVSLQGAADRVQDVLLKVLEEHDARRVTILLAVNDIGTVMPTVRSRCHERWCGGEFVVPSLFGTAQGMLADLKNGRVAEFIEPFRKKAYEAGELLDALSYASKDDPALWAKLRPLHGYTNLSLNDILGALL